MFSGFGDVGVNKSFWLGLEPLHQLTSSGGYTRMRVEMYANNGAWYSAEYDQFSVGNQSTEYRLSVSGYSGDAGDQLLPNNGATFSTYDSGMHNSTAMMMQGGWWYPAFGNFACLNGAFEFMQKTGFFWNSTYYAQTPPRLSHLVGVIPGRLLISRIMITRP